MYDLLDVLEELKKRLPELAWHLNTMSNMDVRYLPKGLFRCVAFKTTLSVQLLLDEIHEDLIQLEQVDYEALQQWKAEQIRRKIHCLVYLQQNQKHHDTKTATLDIKRLLTRQEWMTESEKEIQQLEKTRQALALALSKNKSDPAAALKIQAEIGSIERRETLLRDRVKSRNYQ